MVTIDKNGRIVPSKKPKSEKDSANNKDCFEQARKDLIKSQEKYAKSDEYNRLPASLKAIYNTDKFIDNILFGDIEWTRIPERDNLENPVDSSNGFVQSQFVWLVEATGYVAIHLKRWIKEQLTPELRCWYKFGKPFTNRLIPIQKTCEDLLNVLPARLPNFQQRFMEKYEELKRVASEADSRWFFDFENGIHNFKSASEAFHETILTIHSEAFVYVKKDLDEKPAETGQGNKAINRPNSKTRKIFDDKFKVGGLSINYKNLWHKINNWPCVKKRIEAIINFIECKLKKAEKK